MMPVKKKVYHYTYTCQNKQCGVKFCSPYFRQFCSSDCKERNAEAESMEWQPGDPTIEDIARECKLIQSGDVQCDSQEQYDGQTRQKVKPNWFMEKRIR